MLTQIAASRGGRRGSCRPVSPVDTKELNKLVKIKNELATYHKIIHAKIIERIHSHSGFSNYVVNINIMIDRYSYECILYPCHTCSHI